MIKKIEGVSEAAGIDDISDTWKVVARRHLKTVSGEVTAIWEYCGTLADSKENVSFRRLAFSASRKESPHISCVTGRNDAGMLCLYARIYPMSLRSARSRMGYA